MPISYDKLLVLLESRGRTLYSIKKHIGGATYDKIKRNKGEDISTKTICILCDVLDCQPGDIISYKK